MVGTRGLVWSVIAGWCALFAAIEVSATLQDPVMWILVQHALKQARIDPIVTPGKLSSHTHSLVGANGVSENTTTGELLEKESTCTTSGLAIDMSAYWAPTLYSYNANNDTFSPRPLDYVNTYYLMRGNVAITAFPRGLQLLAGNASRRAAGPTKQNDNTVSYVCLNYKDGSSQTRLMPKGPCPQGLRTQVVLPSCWNGKDLISADHSHVVYPLGDNADNGDCPNTHKIRLATLFYEFVWGVEDQDNTGNSTWVLSNGDAIGYSFHADFIAAWDEEVLQSAIDECAGNLFNNLEACPPLAQHLDRKASQTCSAVSTEATTGAIESLPGCNVVWNGPHAGKGLTKGCNPKKVMIKPENWADSSPSSAIPSGSSSAWPRPTSKPNNNNNNPVAGIKKPQPKPQRKPQAQRQPARKPSKKPTKKPNHFGISFISNSKKKQHDKKKTAHKNVGKHQTKSKKHN